MCLFDVFLVIANKQSLSRTMVDNRPFYTQICEKNLTNRHIDLSLSLAVKRVNLLGPRLFRSSLGSERLCCSVFGAEYVTHMCNSMIL